MILAQHIINTEAAAIQAVNAADVALELALVIEKTARAARINAEKKTPNTPNIELAMIVEKAATAAVIHAEIVLDQTEKTKTAASDALTYAKNFPTQKET